MTAPEPGAGEGVQRCARIVWLGALGWSAVLLACTTLLPLVTVHDGSTGVQPRVTLWSYYGTAALIPAASYVAAVLCVGALTGEFTARPPRLSTAVVAWSLTVCVLLACLGLVLLTHLAGLLAVPGGLLLLAAATASLVAATARSTASR